MNPKLLGNRVEVMEESRWIAIAFSLVVCNFGFQQFRPSSSLDLFHVSSICHAHRPQQHAITTKPQRYTRSNRRAVDLVNLYPTFWKFMKTIRSRQCLFMVCTNKAWERWGCFAVHVRLIRLLHGSLRLKTTCVYEFSWANTAFDKAGASRRMLWIFRHWVKQSPSGSDLQRPYQRI